MSTVVTTVIFAMVPFLVSGQNTGLSPAFFAVIVENLDTSVQWYSSHLGFEELDRNSNDEMGYRQANLTNNGARLELIELKNSVRLSDVLDEQGPPKRLQGFFKMGFNVAQFDDLVKVLRRGGVSFRGRVVEDPKTGQRMAIILDPDGNRIQLFEE